MEIFHRAADLIGLHPRIRLVPVSAPEAAGFADVPETRLHAADGFEFLADGTVLLNEGVGRTMSTRAAAMVLALKRIEAHYQLEGFSQ